MFNADVVIVGTGAAGLFCALSIKEDKNILVITKEDAQSSNSFLAQGGICVQKNDDDYDSFFEDTMKAGHYKNNKNSVDMMIRNSRDVVSDIVKLGVDFEKNGELFKFTKEGGHATNRILYHEDQTGKEITGTLLQRAKERKNIKLIEYTQMIDIIEDKNKCIGIVIKKQNKEIEKIYAKNVVLATGGVGGLYKNSTNFPHITGDSFEISKKHNVKLKNMDYVQIHPTTLYSKKSGRRFLISESVRGEGALLFDKTGKRFVDELIPRDKLTKIINEKMKEQNTEYVYLNMKPIGEKEIKSHFPNIYNECVKEGYDPIKDLVPVVPAQHYFMGGIDVDKNSQTSLNNLYAVGETSCNGVHGANRLASNSLLESLVFAKKAATHICKNNEQVIKVRKSS